jgi:endonuclease YncB( thermonuclease family)
MRIRSVRRLATLVITLIGIGAAAQSSAVYKLLQRYYNTQPTEKSVVDAEIISGVARFHDAETPVIGNVRLDLDRLDAPELDQTCVTKGKAWACGKGALNAVVAKVGGRALECRKVSADMYKRPVVLCTVDGEDLNAWIVANGWAVVHKKYTRVYLPQQEQARGHCLNLWREACGKSVDLDSVEFDDVAGFQTPWAYRACRAHGLRSGEHSG